MTPGGKRVALVAAVAENGVIGNGKEIPWRVPGEQKHFKAFTLGHVLLMGRATYDSIGRPLPGRTTVVLTRDPEWSADGVLAVHDVAEALRLADGLEGDLMVAGGAQVYAALLPVADEQVLSEVPLVAEGDVRYPEVDREAWEVAEREPRDGYTLVTWRRRG